MSATKWVSLDGTGQDIMAELKIVRIGDRTVPRYEIWPADYPKPEGNPMKFKPETLRMHYKPEDE